MNPFVALYLGFCIMIVVIVFHAELFLRNEKITTTFHGVWTTILAIAWIILVWLSKWDWWLIAGFAFMRGGLYSPILNLIRFRFDFSQIFYLHSDDKTGADFDAWMLKHESIYKPFLAFCLTGFIAIHFLL